jgi:hypothetical protein
MTTLRRFPYTAAAALAAAAFVATVLLADLELVQVEFFVRDPNRRTKADECLLAVAAVAVGFGLDRAADARRRRREAETQAERLRVLRATMRTVQDIVNNFLNGLQLIRVEAEGAVPPETLELLDSLSRDTAARLKAMGDLESVPVKPTAAGTVIDYGQG